MASTIATQASQCKQCGRKHQLIGEAIKQFLSPSGGQQMMSKQRAPHWNMVPRSTCPPSSSSPFIPLPGFLRSAAACTVQGCGVAQPCHISSEVEPRSVVVKLLGELVRHLLYAVLSSSRMCKSCPGPCSYPPPGKLSA